MVLFVLVVNIAFHRPALEVADVRVGARCRADAGIAADDRDRHPCSVGNGAVKAKGDRKAPLRNPRSRRYGRLCTDKTGTLTEATIELVRAIDGHGAESDATYAYAYVNSRFESGMKSPLDEAILAAHPFDMTGWQQDRRGAVRFRTAAGLGPGRASSAKRRLIVKGAPEDLLRLSGRYETADGDERPLDEEARQTFDAT